MLKSLYWNSETQRVEFGPEFTAGTGMDAGLFQLGNISDPVDPTDAANKRYVDSVMGSGTGGLLVPLERPVEQELRQVSRLCRHP